ncbi:type I glutamate--ammonia ligase [Desulfurobacterium thermolithotrophum]|nr:type I glutamate--ammonia ligase [Desulfurobacterium thermolithotrophum]
MKPKNAKEVVELIQREGIKFVDLRFTDMFGTWHHVTFPAHEISEESFEQGLFFDGSSIRQWQPINASDMMFKLDPTTATVDPLSEIPTLVVIADIVDPVTKEPYHKDPRNIAKKAIEYLKSTGIGDTVYCGPEPEFFIFDDVKYDVGMNFSFYEVDSVEGIWRTGADENPNLGHKIKVKGGYFPVPPADQLDHIRKVMAMKMEEAGLVVEALHHEVATGGQGEIDIRFGELVTAADNLMWVKYIVKNVAKMFGKTATFMPKPLFGDNGTGMHTHMSIWKNGENLFHGDSYAGLSETALYFIGGIIKHAKAVCAFTNPTVNSYKRLVPGYEAPVNLCYSARNRSASIRVPVVTSPKAKRIEVRFPDSSGAPYLAFTALLMAGLDGIENKIHPGEPVDKNLYDLPPEELKDIPTVPGSLAEAIDALEKDYEFLTKGGVMTEQFLEDYIEYKRNEEIDPIRLRPTPMEFFLYFDV